MLPCSRWREPSTLAHTYTQRARVRAGTRTCQHALTYQHARAHTHTNAGTLSSEKCILLGASTGTPGTRPGRSPEKCNMLILPKVERQVLALCGTIRCRLSDSASPSSCSASSSSSSSSSSLSPSSSLPPLSCRERAFALLPSPTPPSSLPLSRLAPSSTKPRCASDTSLKLETGVF